MIEEGLYTILKNAGAVAAIVSTRIYPELLPQGSELPAISFERISTGREMAHSGPTGVVRSSFQVSCWAPTPLRSKQLAAAVVAALHGYSGTVASVRIFKCAVVNESDLFDAEIDVFHVPVEVEILHREA